MNIWANIKTSYCTESLFLEKQPQYRAIRLSVNIESYKFFLIDSQVITGSISLCPLGKVYVIVTPTL